MWRITAFCGEGRKLVLEELHVIKRLARSYLWCPGLDGDIKQKVKNMYSISEQYSNGYWTSFCSYKFRFFMKQNGIQHVKTPPYHPASNGLAECYVQVFKDGMRKSTGGSIESRVARFLSYYHTTPQSITGTTPAELMFGRKPWTRSYCLPEANEAESSS